MSRMVLNFWNFLKCAAATVRTVFVCACLCVCVVYMADRGLIACSLFFLVISIINVDVLIKVRLVNIIGFFFFFLLFLRCFIISFISTYKYSNIDVCLILLFIRSKLNCSHFGWFCCCSIRNHNCIRKQCGIEANKEWKTNDLFWIWIYL